MRVLSHFRHATDKLLKYNQSFPIKLNQTPFFENNQPIRGKTQHHVMSPNKVLPCFRSLSVACRKCDKTIINRKIGNFYIEAIPKKNLNSDKKYFFGHSEKNLFWKIFFWEKNEKIEIQKMTFFPDVSWQKVDFGSEIFSSFLTLKNPFFFSRFFEVEKKYFLSELRKKLGIASM